MSSLFDRKKIIPRYKIIGYVMVVLGLLIVGKAFYIATVKRDYWMQVADRLKRDSFFTSGIQAVPRLQSH